VPQLKLWLPPHPVITVTPWNYMIESKLSYDPLSTSPQRLLTHSRQTNQCSKPAIILCCWHWKPSHHCTNGKSTTPIMLKNVLYAPEIAATLYPLDTLTMPDTSPLLEVNMFNSQCRQQAHRSSPYAEWIVPSVSAKWHLSLCTHSKQWTHHCAVPQPYWTYCTRSHMTPSQRSIGNWHPTRQIKQGTHLWCLHLCQDDMCICTNYMGEPRANMYSDEVHLDMWGPFPMKTLGRKGYYVTFTDDHSCETHLELLYIKVMYLMHTRHMKQNSMQKWVNIKAL